MTQSYTSDDLKSLFAFPFQDTDWKNKFLIGSLVTFSAFIIPIVPFLIIYGYIVQIMRRIIVDKGDPFLPEWTDWGKLFLDGAKLVGAILVYVLPLMLVMFAGFFIFFFSIGLTGGMAAATEGSGQEPSPLLAMVPVLGTFGMMAMFGCMTIFALALGFLMPAIMGHVVATDSFAAAFRFGEWWAIFRANIGGFLIAYIIVLAISMALNFVFYLLYITIVLCCLMPFILPPVTLYILVLQSVVFAQAYRDGAYKLEHAENPVT